LQTLCNTFCAGILLLLCCGVCAGYYIEPPDWNDSNDFTHQNWDFGDDGEYGYELVSDMGLLPLGSLPDGEPNWVNQFGEPCLISFDNTNLWMKGWYYYPPALTTDRVALYGGNGDTTLEFYIPNVQRDKFWQKQFWVQMTFFARMDGVENYEITVARDANYKDVNNISLTFQKFEELNEPEGNTGKWYRVTNIYRFDDRPGAEYVKLRSLYNPEAVMGASMIDQVDIDSRYLNADLFEDGFIDLFDYAELAAKYGEQDYSTDLYPDGVIDINDLSVLLGYWLEQEDN
jgi:hypothetical protein